MPTALELEARRLEDFCRPGGEAECVLPVSMGD